MQTAVMFLFRKSRRKEHTSQTYGKDFTSIDLPNDDRQLNIDCISVVDQQNSKNQQNGSIYNSVSLASEHFLIKYLQHEYCQLLSIQDNYFGKLFSQGLTGLKQLCQLPQGVNYNEWIISHECSFFASINLIYHSIREFCTPLICPNLSGYETQQISYWLDEKGHKIKCVAQQHMDFALGYVDKILSATCKDDDEEITKSTTSACLVGSYGIIGSNLWKSEFNGCSSRDSYCNLPMSNQETVRSVVKSILKVMCHLYHAHFEKIIQLHLNKHINSVFLHFMVFNLQFKFLEAKDGEILNGLFHNLLNQATKIITDDLDMTYDGGGILK